MVNAEGNRKMTVEFPLATTSWDHAEYAAMSKVIDSGKFTMGEEVSAFEVEFASRFGSQHAVMSNSGSSANLLALSAIKYSSLNPSDGRDEVIVPAVSWSTTYYPVTQMGYKLKFVDIDLGTLNASLESISRAVDERTAGLVIVNLLGNPSDLTEIRELADELNLFMIEDNAESMGATYDGKEAGTFGHIGTFSTFFSHHISTMEGGVSVTNSLELKQVMSSLRAHGWTRDLPQENYVFDKTGEEFEDSFRFVLPGYNLRPLELEGAIGRVQLTKLDNIVAGRRSNAERFAEVMKEHPEFMIQKENGRSSWFGFSLVLGDKFQGRRKSLVHELKSKKIAVRPIVAGNFTMNPVLRHLSHCTIPPLPNSNKIHADGLFIGNHHYEMGKELQLLDDALTSFKANNLT